MRSMMDDETCWKIKKNLNSNKRNLIEKQREKEKKTGKYNVGITFFFVIVLLLLYC